MLRPRRLLLPMLAIGMVLTACGGTTEEPPATQPEPPAAEEPAPEAPEEGETEVPEEPAVEPDEDAEEGPDEADEGQEAPDDEASGASEVVVYFVRAQDSGTWVEPEVHALDEPTEAVARAAMQLLFAGQPHDPDLTSIPGSDVDVLATTVTDRVLIVDVSGNIVDVGVGSAGEVAFAEQLAHTAATFSTVDAVQLWVDGEPIDELWGHLIWSEPIEPDNFALSPITIEEPSAAADQPSAAIGDVSVRGQATVFEANFVIRLYGPDGTLLAETFVTASEGGPGRGTWEHVFSIDEPGTYMVEVSEQDPSDGEGRPEFVSQREIEVS